MKLVGFDELYQYDFDAHIINAARQHWSEDNVFSCTDAPKATDMLLYSYACGCEYTLLSGEVITAKKNSVVYVPRGSRYRFRCTELEKTDISTIIINFDLLGKHGELFSISDEIQVISPQNHMYFKSLFEDIVELSLQMREFPCMLKAYLFKIIGGLCVHFRESNLRLSKFDIISVGIDYLEHSDDVRASVKDIAKMCNVSQTYFEKLFKEYAGVTPIRYKLDKILKLAKRFLILENRSIKETAGLLGFDDLPYFYRVFKKHTGMTPSEYYEKYRESGSSF